MDRNLLNQNSLVAILCGGDTAEGNESKASGWNAFNALRQTVSCVLVHYCRGDWSLLASEHHGHWQGQVLLGRCPPILYHAESKTEIVPDLCMICMHGFPGESGQIQGYLTMLGIPYSGSGVLASAMASDKYRCSRFLEGSRHFKIPQQIFLPLEFIVESFSATRSLGIPFILKPNSLGSSIGVTCIHRPEAADHACKAALMIGGDFVAEEFIEGIEITAGAIRLKQQSIILPEVRVVRTGADISHRDGLQYFTNHKSTTLKIPSGLAKETSYQVACALQEIGQQLDLQGCYRVDFILRESDLYFLEVNSSPGVSPLSAFTTLLRAGGRTEDQMFKELVDNFLPGR